MSTDQDVISLLRELIRFDTSNWGDGKANGETPCATWIAHLLREHGYSPQLVTRPDAPHRGNVIVRVSGRDKSLPGLLVQGHLDVVPVEPNTWSVDPFAGEIRDGYLYGRGATDMKDMCASMLATLLKWAETSFTPRRTIVFAFVADEESGSYWGADFLVDEHPELFAGCAASIGEDGAICQPVKTVDGRIIRLYPIACAERGSAQVRIIAHGPSGHGSRPNGDDAIHHMLAAVHRVSEYQWPLRLSAVVKTQLIICAAALNLSLNLTDEKSILAVIDQLGDAAGALPWTIRVSATPTVLQAGSQVNVIPSLAIAEIDVRVPPGADDETVEKLAELIGNDVEWEFIHQTKGIESDSNSYWFAAMKAAVESADPEAIVVPYCMGGGTDSKSFARLGLQTYGFTPLTCDEGGRRPESAHGADERNPISSLTGGAAILNRFLSAL